MEELEYHEINCRYSNLTSRCNFCKYSYSYSNNKFKLDFINVTIKYQKKMWDKPRASINNIRIVKYIELTSKHKINKKIEQLNNNIFNLDKIICKAVHQFFQFNEIKNYILREKQKTHHSKINQHKRIDNMIDTLNAEISNYNIYYSIIKLYQNNINKNKYKFQNHLKVIQGYYICYICYCNINKSKNVSIKYKSKYYICSNCNNIRNNKVNENKDHECMVCYDKYKHKDMVYTRCGNGHNTCLNCYNILINYTSQCPMCRGNL